MAKDLRVKRTWEEHQKYEKRWEARLEKIDAFLCKGRWLTWLVPVFFREVLQSVYDKLRNWIS